jgi:hypothetical protein
MIPTIDPELQGLIPHLTGDEHALLESSIVQEGCRDALVVWNGALVDGHNRFEICTRLGIDYQVVALEGYEDRTSVIAWMLHNQLGRRNLSDATRIRLALRLEPILREQSQIRMLRGKHPVQNSAQGPAKRTRDVVAGLAGVSHDTVSRVKTILADGSPETIAAMEADEISIHQAYQDVRKLLRPALSADKPPVTRVSRKNKAENVSSCDSCAVLREENERLFDQSKLLEQQVERLNDQIERNLSDAVSQAQQNMPGIERLIADLATRDNVIVSLERTIADLQAQQDDAEMPATLQYSAQDVRRIMTRGSDQERRAMATWQQQQERDMACV